MPKSGTGRRAISNVLIVVGAVLLLAVGSCYGWTRYQGRQLRTKLRSTPAPVAAMTASASPTFMPTPTAPPSPTPTLATAPTQQGEATMVPPTATATTVPSATAAPPAAPTPTPAPISAGPPVRIVIPDLEIDAAVVEMGWQVVDTANGPQSEWVIPKNEAGHHINSAPLGVPDNIVISGHNNIYGRVFEPISLAWDDDNRTRVDDFTDGSDILNGRTIQLFDAAGQEFDYTITAFYRLRDTGVSLAQRIDNARFMQPTADPQLTLVTCWPPWNNTHRLIVIARPAGGS